MEIATDPSAAPMPAGQLGEPLIDHTAGFELGLPPPVLADRPNAEVILIAQDPVLTVLHRPG